MKGLLLTFATLLTLTATGQNWQTFFSTKNTFFKGGTYLDVPPVFYPGLIRAYHSDSISMAGADSIFHIFKSPRTTGGLCLNEHGASWMGDKVIIKSNGDNILFNINNDSIIFKTQTSLNDSFVIYRFPNNDYMNAIVTELNIDSISGVPDSIKTITLDVRDPNGNSVPNSYNGHSFRISKNNGIVSNFNWSNFPFSTDTSVFSHVFVNRMTSGEIYDYNIGDIFQFHNGCYNPPSPGSYVEQVVTGKWFSTLNDTVFYERKISIKSYTFIPLPPHIDSTFNTYMDTVFYTDLNNYLFNGSFPEQTIVDTNLASFGGLKWYFMQSDTSLFNGRSFITYSLISYIWNGTCFEQNIYNEYIVNGFTEVAGCGSWQNLIYDNTTGGPDINCFSQLIYFKKGNEIYGNPTIVSSLEELDIQINSLHIYPNPASSIIHLAINNDLPIYLYNVFGEIVLQVPKNTQPMEITTLDITTLPSGIYMIQAGNISQKFVKM